MKRIALIITLLTFCSIIYLPHNKINVTNNKNFNIYIEENGDYVRQNTGTFPTSGYVLNTTESSCTGGGTLSQNPTTKKINLSMNSSEKCDLYFDIMSGAANTILELVGNADPTSTSVINVTAPSGASCTNSLAYDGTTDNNLRYVGADPCNYVTFNGETAGWRIIGAMNNVDDGTGTTETRLKLIRATSLGLYSWDSADASIHNGYGINDWSQADLMTELNGDYLDTTLNANTLWYNDWKNTKETQYDYTKGLTASAQNLIKNAKWYLGSLDPDAFNNTGQNTSSYFYQYERGTIVWGSISGQTCDDGSCPRATTWTGKVAIPYPSDFGYAVGGTVRTTCLAKDLNAFNSDNCYTNDWLKTTSVNWRWLLTPYSGTSYFVLAIHNNGYLDGNYAMVAYEVLPTIYLKPDAIISEGDGSETNPYVIE